MTYSSPNKQKIYSCGKIIFIISQKGFRMKVPKFLFDGKRIFKLKYGSETNDNERKRIYLTYDFFGNKEDIDQVNLEEFVEISKPPELLYAWQQRRQLEV